MGVLQSVAAWLVYLLFYLPRRLYAGAVAASEYEPMEEERPFQQTQREHTPVVPLPTTQEGIVKRLMKCSEEDLYGLLNVEPEASEAAIKQSFRKQSLMVHPDKCSLPRAQEAFQRLSNAYQVLSDPAKRQQYDSQQEDPGELLQEFFKKMADTVNLRKQQIYCTACGLYHPKTRIDRPATAARWCSEHNTYHKANDGDVWGEREKYFWVHFYICIGRQVFEVTEYIACQGLARSVMPGSHYVTVRATPMQGRRGRGSFNSAAEEVFDEELLAAFLRQMQMHAQDEGAEAAASANSYGGSNSKKKTHRRKKK